MKQFLMALKALLLISFMSGCASLEKWSNFEDEQAQEKVKDTQNQTEEASSDTAFLSESSNEETFQERYRERFLQKKSSALSHSKAIQQSSKDINYYVRGLMQDLVGNLQYVNGKTPVAVTSFVFLDGSYEYADIVGKQLSESFMHEVHKFGIPLVDFKSTDFIRVTPHGDFVLSQDFLDLDGNLPVKYVITGTLVKHTAGYLVNARIVGMKSKAVVGTAQGMLPSSVINSLISSDLINKEIELTSGT